jgi:hypothetical protein
MNPSSSTRAQRRQALQEQILKNRNLLGKVEFDQPSQPPKDL